MDDHTNDAEEHLCRLVDGIGNLLVRLANAAPFQS